MVTDLQQYGTGAGIPLGAGVGGTAALVAGLESEFAVVAGFGVAGGLVVGGFAGRYTDTSRGRDNWAFGVVAVTLLVSLLAGGLLGVLASWMVEASYVSGLLAGGGAGGAFSLLLSGVLLSFDRQQRQTDSAA